MDGIVSSAIRNRSQIEFCIDAFVEETGYIPTAARSVRDSTQLSPQLERLVGAMTQASAWRAWTDGAHHWFVQGRLAECTQELPGKPTVYLIFRDQDAMPVIAGSWCRTAPAQWDVLQFFTCLPVMSVTG